MFRAAKEGGFQVKRIISKVHGPRQAWWASSQAVDWGLGLGTRAVEMEVFPGAGLSLKPHPTIHLRGDTGNIAVLLILCLYNSYRRDWVPVVALTFQ